MIKLFYSLRSPFARRIRLALLRLELPFEPVELNVFEPTPQFLATNPLATVPVMVTDAGQTIPDSATILEYLHETQGGRIWPADPLQRTQVRSLSTWAEGIMTASVVHYLERLRATPDVSVLEEQEQMIERTLTRLAEDQNAHSLLVGGNLTQAGWDLAVALDYLDLRLPGKFAATRQSETKQASLIQKIRDTARASKYFVNTLPPPA